MADNKKSVLLYCDIILTVKELTDEEAGKLFKHYLSYINDLNPEPPDKLTQIVFEPIKQNLKRDLKKWESKSLKNKEIAKDGWVKRKDANACERIKVDAKHADKDKVTVKVTVKDKDIYIPSESEFLEYCKTIKEFEFKNYEFSLKAKYESWVNAGWKDGNGDKIKVWKTKIKNTYPYLKPIFTNTDNTEQVKKRNQPA